MAANPIPMEPANEKVSILIVDDRPDKLLAHETVLSELNQNLVRATSGIERIGRALRASCTRNPDPARRPVDSIRARSSLNMVAGDSALGTG